MKLAAILVLCLAALAQTPTPVMTVDVPVLVTDKKGQPVQGLDKDLFQLNDDGKPQRIDSMDSQPRPVALALIIDTYDDDALGQAHRSAPALMAMVGDLGEVALYTPGASGVRLVALSSDRNKVEQILRTLPRSPVAPLGAGAITEPTDMAVRDLSSVPTSFTRAALIIAKTSARTGSAAQSLVEQSMTQAITIFRLAPNQPAGAPDDINPISPEVAGTGQGSQRVPQTTPPVDQHGDPGMGSQPYVNLGPSLDKAKSIARAVVEPHDLDYVYDSGGMTLAASNDVEFDQRLALIANDLRSLYHLYYSPDDLTKSRTRHLIHVTVQSPGAGQSLRWFYRRSYLGAAPVK